MKQIITIATIAAITNSGILYAQDDALNVSPTGNVGIGVANALNKLQVAGNLHMDGNAIYLKKNPRDHSSFVIWDNVTDVVNIAGARGVSLGRSIDDTKIKAALTIDVNGNVGIGATSPKATLEVNGRVRDQTGFIMPVGAIVAYGSETPPDGWLLCNGQSCANYPDLQKVVGNNVPDLRGRFVVGVGQGKESNYKTGDAGGAEKVTLIVDEIPAHSHRVIGNTGSDGHDEYAAKGRTNLMQGDRGGSYNSTGVGGNPYIENTGGGKGHENRPPYYALTYIIKY